MLDIAKKVKIRFRKSKDFNKTIDKMIKEGYTIFKEYNEYTKLYTITIRKYDKENIRNANMGYLVKIVYEDITDTTSEYKQAIWGIYY